MKIMTSYCKKITSGKNGRAFDDTFKAYRSAVDLLIDVCLAEWKNISGLNNLEQINYINSLVHTTRSNRDIYGFDTKFYKFPSYLRLSAISAAVGKVSSYQSNLANWMKNPAGKQPAVPTAGYSFPALYRTNMYEQTGKYTARIKVWIRNTWDWINITLRKSDCDYIQRYCRNRRECTPYLVKKHKNWVLTFPFEENVKLPELDVMNSTIASVDLGINHAATVSVMRPDGTILGRHFLNLPREEDSLVHALNRLKKAQQHGNRRTPRLWNRVNGLNADIASKTAGFIIDMAVLYNADVIVFEHLDLNGKIRGSKKQRLHLWKARAIQTIVTAKAHRLGMRVNHVNAWNTSRLAYDGSGRVLRGHESTHTDGNYSLCEFTTGKIYNCDLNASYNIGARYFIREILKSLSATLRLGIEAKVPQCTRRSTCTLSDLITLHAVLCNQDVA